MWFTVKGVEGCDSSNHSTCDCREGYHLKIPIGKKTKHKLKKERKKKKNTNKTTTKTKPPPTVTAWVIMTIEEEDTQEGTVGEVEK